MIVKLYPTQISKFWNIIKFGLEKSLPPVASKGHDRYQRLLESLLSGQMQCWASIDDSGEFEGIGITTILEENYNGSKDLLVYSVYAYKKTTQSTWIQALKTIFAFCKEMGCKRLVGFSTNPQMVQIAENAGADVSTTFVTLEVPQG